MKNKQQEFHGAKNVKEKYRKLFEKFETIYIHSEEDDGAKKFVENITSMIPAEKCFIINSKALRSKRPVRVAYKR